ncbi:alr0857 family protein [Oscillatoria salina]|uniref:alr0857 family protein n=1 Tax=Oscillatoria salina TaxID=331517 RepID=UPI0013BA1B56|nr:alr0857 family protein [Oscillatoria salina]MBZ8183052.1 hypothetical protein [Oscillatoria salina IIICB1]NET91233.1 hypothetical protein [Kamptonema sp. SIO1D9]
MLKLIYTENGFNMERLAQPLEEWVATRVILALRAGNSLIIQPSTASFLLPADLPHLPELEAIAWEENLETLEFSICDAEFVEVTLQGTWIATDPRSEEGILVTAMSDRAEFFLYKLWIEAQELASLISD